MFDNIFLFLDLIEYKNTHIIFLFLFLFWCFLCFLGVSLVSELFILTYTYNYPPEINFFHDWFTQIND